MKFQPKGKDNFNKYLKEKKDIPYKNLNEFV